MQVADAVQYMHSEDIIHGDLKAVCTSTFLCFLSLTLMSKNNILISARGVAQVSDFGLSRYDIFPGDGPSSYRGNFRWRAPELLSGNSSRSLASDIYSLARVMLEVCISFTLSPHTTELMSDHLRLSRMNCLLHISRRQKSCRGLKSLNLTNHRMKMQLRAASLMKCGT